MAPFPAFYYIVFQMKHQKILWIFSKKCDY